MGFFDKVKKAFGSKKGDESQNSVNDEKADGTDLVQTTQRQESLFSSNLNILFVCTTNTVISPMAEVIYNSRVTGKTAFSAGLIAISGGRASNDAIKVCSFHGIDLSKHHTVSIDDIPIGEMDLILTSSGMHKDKLKMIYPDSNIFTIKEYAGYSDLDIGDPFGGDLTNYKNCFNEINEAIGKIIGEETGIVDGEASVEDDYVNDEIDKPESINQDDNLIEEIQSNDSEETRANEEIIDEPTLNEKIRNFKYLDELIHSGAKEIVLDSDIVLGDGEESEYKEGIRLNVDDLTIDGNGHTIDAKGKTRIFYCTGKNVIIKNIILKNGYAEEDGGTIYNSYGELTVFGSIFSENMAYRYGGAIYNNGALTVSDSTFQKNTVNLCGGAIYNDHGGLTVSGSTFSDNAAEKRNFTEGGAIYNRGELTVSGSTFTGNIANGGGAIYNIFGEVTVSDSTLQKNTANVSGGAIMNYSKLIVSDSMLQENTAYLYGGAIDNRDEIDVSDSALTGNIANDAGAIYNNKGEVTVSGSAFTGNMGKSSWGAIFNEEGNFKVFNCDFLNNKSSISIIGNASSLQISDSDFLGNNASNIIVNRGNLANFSIFNGEFKNNDIDESIIFNNGKSCTVEKTVFEKHLSNAIINKGDLTLIVPKINYGGKLILNEKYIFIKRFSDGLEDKIYGEGMVENAAIPLEEKFDFGYLDKKIHESETKEITLEEDITFENYEIYYYEGGIELDIDNLVIDGNGHSIDAQDKTRIFYCTGKNITLKNITLKNGRSHKNYDNPFNNNSGAIRINRNINLTILNCRFINNTSEEMGGAIYNSDGKLTVSSSVFSENTAYKYGGAIYNGDEGMLAVSGSVLTENTADDGGAIYNKGDLTIFDSTLRANTAKVGGAIKNHGKVTVSDSNLTENMSKLHGGTISNDYGGMLMVSGSELAANTANGSAGAIDNNGKLIVSDCMLQENTAKVAGGAIDNQISGDMDITGCQFQENATKYYGGAIDNNGKLSLAETIFIGNSTQKNGGAICLRGQKKYESDNCTFKDNKPDDVYEDK